MSFYPSEQSKPLSACNDVNISNPSNGDGLVHDGNNWTNIPIMTQAQNVATGVHQFLYNRVKSSQVVGGLTITPNTDGSFTVGAGTATSNAQLLVSGIGTGSWSQAEQKLPIGEYYATCEGGTAGIYLKVMVEENDQQKTVYGSGQESYVVSSAPSNLIALIQVTSGTVVPAGGIILKPLLRLQSDSDKTITPYAKTNRELTDDTTGHEGISDYITPVTSGNSIETNNMVVDALGKLRIVHVAIKFSADVNSTVKVATAKAGSMPRSLIGFSTTTTGTAKSGYINTNGEIYVDHPRAGWTYAQLIYVAQ